MRSTRPSPPVAFASPTASTTVQHEHVPDSSVGLRGSAWEEGGSGDKDIECAKRQGRCTQHYSTTAPPKHLSRRRCRLRMQKRALAFNYLPLLEQSNSDPTLPSLVRAFRSRTPHHLKFALSHPQ
ncbi:hypothetical protein PILCRDRAFT_16650 [Piloderma croceum F 1598]|uniref:Uncharacterized protein n=1 Tax=Piloderma croceum (strain F 1598) TaxID=765440 RepID=A0A0C3ADI9_PILCF|nr:hypothetical protein PILCRDRAFT_16650 [Piloderma croceum F 1598]